VHERYAYTSFRLRPRSWPKLIEHVRARPRGLYGLFSGQIGLGVNEGVLIEVGDGASTALDGCDAVLESQSERLVATVRPRDPAPPTRPGVYAHRWFDLAESDWREFLALSEGAWPPFEADYEAEIQGFWRSQDVAPPRARVLLVTCYASLAEWERSRAPISDATHEAGRRFRRRHELTQDTRVVTTERRLP
jgi:hypothetical protein